MLGFAMKPGRHLSWQFHGAERAFKFAKFENQTFPDAVLSGKSNNNGKS